MKINGNLVLNTDATGELQNVYLERISAAPAFNSSEKGRVYFNTTTALYYYNDGSAWQPFATGGNAAATQLYVNNLLASVGTSVTGTGTWNGSTAFTSDPILSGATSVTNALTLLSAASYGHDQLSELVDVTLGSLSNNQFLIYNSGVSKWVNHTLVAANLSDVTASAAELNKLTGVTTSTTELNYVTGVTSAIQTQLNNKQPLNANLTNLATLASTGIVVQSAANTFTERSLVAPVEGFTISNADGVAGNPTFSLANDLAALEGLATTGFIVRTGDGSATTRSVISGSSARLVVTNGNGVAASPTVDLALVTDSGTGAFNKLSTDAYGRVTGTQSVVAADISALVGAIYVDATGDTMTGNLVFNGGATVTGLPNPSNGTDATNKNYVDAAVAGLSWKQAVAALSATNVSISSAPATIDGYTLVAGDRVLLKGQTTSTENGLYVFTAAAAALTRATDAATFAALDGAAVFVESGTVYADTGWTQSTVLTGFGGQVWAQFTGSGTYTAGTGLSFTGNTIDVNLGAGIAQLPTDEVGIDLYQPSALILTIDGTSHSTATAAQLHLLLKASGGLTQNVLGLEIPSAGVTNAMLANSSVTLDVDGGGTGSLALGDTLSIFGTSAQGISTSVVGSTITITASDASSSQKGVAKFAATTFAVTAGNVNIASAGVTNVMLANSSVTFTGDTGSSSLALGNAFALVGDTTSNVSVAVTSGQAKVSVAAATVSTLGVASFSATDFAVSSGAVSLVAKALNSLTDVAVSAPAAGQALVYSATSSKFVNEKFYHLYSAGSASTSHVVTHNIGQKYCNVTIVDATDEVVIPQSITFDTNNQLTVTFTSAIVCKIIVMGVNVQ